MATSMVDLPTKTFFVPPFRHVPQHHFKKNLSHQIQCWLRINCGRAFVWEMTYPWEISNIILIIFFLTIFIPPFISGKLTWPQKKIWRFHQIPPSIVQGRGGWCHAQLKNCLSVFDHFVGLVLRGQKPMLQSFRAQSLHLQLKSIDWFLYDRNISQYKR